MSEIIDISVEIEPVIDQTVTPEGDVADITVTQEAEEVIEIVVESGVPGARGYTGSRGAGYDGSRGDVGYTGSAGSAGSNGFTGSRGLAGEYAALGFTGSKGDIGSLGYTGSSGAGFVGSRGVVGFVGSQGIDGDIGPIGYTGSFGARGYTGSRGLLGYAGSQGEQGVGFVGSRGVQGVIGYTGSRGVLGYTGSRGQSGVLGFTGSKGEQGDTGFVGSRGLFGFTGSVGVGFVGSKGTVGFVGSRGLLGYTGSAGSGGGGSANVGPLDFWADDVFTTAVTSRPLFTGGAISSGSVVAGVSANSIFGYNPFGVTIRAAGFGTSSGYRFVTTSDQLHFGQIGLKFRCSLTFSESAMVANILRVGFLDITTDVDPTDGAYFELVSGGGQEINAKTANNASYTANTTTFAANTNTTYMFDIEVNAAGSAARFRIYHAANTTPVFDVTNSANIPTGSTRLFGCGIVATRNNEGTGSAIDILSLHRMGYGTIPGAQAVGIP